MGKLMDDSRSMKRSHLYCYSLLSVNNYKVYLFYSNHHHSQPFFYFIQLHYLSVQEGLPLPPPPRQSLPERSFHCKFVVQLNVLP